MTSGPYLVREVRPTMAVEFGTLWLAVSRAGGAVGFRPDAPERDVREAAEQVVAAVRDGRESMLALEADGMLAGAAFLQRGAGPIVEHRATVVRLMVHPDLQGAGRGAQLLAATVDAAGGLGLHELLLSARGGTGLVEFYVKQGWFEVGRWRRALRVGPDDWRDEHWFQWSLTPDRRAARTP